MRKFQEILDKLPSSWEEITLKTAIKYLNVEMEFPVDGDEFEKIQIGLNNIYKTIAVLTDISIEEAREIPKQWIDKMAVKTAFMNTNPIPKKESKIKWKGFDEISYDDFISFIQLQNEQWIDKMPTVIKAFSKNKLSEEEILEMNMLEVHTGFFLLMRQLKKSIRRMKIQTSNQLIKQGIKMITNKILFRKK